MARTDTVVAATRRAFTKQFDAMGVKAIGADGGRAFRKKVMADVESEIAASPASRASAYNTVRKENIDDNTIPGDLLGRTAKKTEVKVEAAAKEESAPSTD